MIEPIDILQRLIATPSYSRDEGATADLLMDILKPYAPERQHNNVWCVNRHFNNSLPTLLLNSHHDTVRPVSTWTLNPHQPNLCGDKLCGLGSNDAGASVVSLIALFERFYSAILPFNLILAITAEEEVGGVHGMRAFLPMLKERGFEPTMALVGEPTNMQPAIAERGLLVLDCTARGVAGHAARNEGVNAIYKAMQDIELLRNFSFEQTSEILGPIKISVTQINAGTQHNVVPDECRFVADVRTTDAYTNEKTVEIIRAQLSSEVRERSTRVQASVIDKSHPLVKAAVEIGGTPFVSPTTSDMSLMHGLPSLKMGPGDSSRSHKADEYILLTEIADAIEKYTLFLETLSTLI